LQFQKAILIPHADEMRKEGKKGEGKIVISQFLLAWWLGSSFNTWRLNSPNSCYTILSLWKMFTVPRRLFSVFSGGLF